MFQILTKVACGNLTDIPSKFPKLSSEIFTIIEIAVPLLLVIMGTLDLFKGITADKEDEMAKGRKMFVKRLITGALVFFVFAITKLVISFLDNKTSYNNITGCMNCFIRNECDPNPVVEVIEEKEETNKEEERKKQIEDQKKDIQDQKDDIKEETINVQQKAKLTKQTGRITDKYSGVDYYLYVPKNATKGMPLVIFLHGVGEKGNISGVKNLRPVTMITDGTLSGLEEFIFLAPVSPKNLHWGEAATWTNLNNLIDYITSEYSIDTSRLYLTGFSAGGMGVWGLVNKYPTKFRAAVAVSGNIYGYNVNNLKNIPIYAIVGGNEVLFVTPMQKMVNQINNAGGNAKLKIIPQANHVMTQNTYSTRELYQWLLSQ